MFWNADASVARYRDALRALMELEWWYAEMMAAREGRSLADTLGRYTEFHYYSTCHDISPEGSDGWHAALAEATERPDGCAWLFARFLEPRLARDLRDAGRKRRASFAGFHAEFRPRYFDGGREDWLTLHFVNAFTPDSPFRHREELVEGLLALLDGVTRKRPDVTRMQCASWLNNMPAFLEFFPPAWREDSFACWPMEGSTGWWGQFIDRRGDFHAARAEAFRRAGTFAWPNRFCACGVEEWRRHLEGFLAVADGSLPAAP